MRMLLYFLAMLSLASAGIAYADTPPEQRSPIDPPAPPSTEPFAPPPEDPLDEIIDDGPTIVESEGDKREEFRSNGRLYMVKITPKDAPPYYLVDNEGRGHFIRYNTLDEAKLVVPRWVIFTF